MASFEDRAKPIVSAAAQIARLQNAEPEATVLEKSIASLAQTGSAENWGETTDLFTLMLEVPIHLYAAIEDQRSGLEKLILKRATQIARTSPGNAITEVVISPTLPEASRPTEPNPSDPDIREEIPSFWQPGYFRLFISHTSTNKESAHRLKESLSAYNIAAFVAHDDIEPTKEWQAEIERALRTMDAMSAIITQDFYESRWCDQEVGIAIGRGKLVVPVCKDSIPHGFLGKFQGFNAKGLPPSDVAQQVADILIGHVQSAERMADALVERLITSNTWESSKKTIQLIEKVPQLNDLQFARLIQSLDENSQVGSAYGVPARIKKLASKVAKSSIS